MYRYAVLPPFDVAGWINVDALGRAISESSAQGARKRILWRSICALIADQLNGLGGRVYVAGAALGSFARGSPTLRGILERWSLRFLATREGSGRVAENILREALAEAGQERAPRKELSASGLALRHVQRHDSSLHQSEEGHAGDSANYRPRESARQKKIGLESNVECAARQSLKDAEQASHCTASKCSEPYGVLCGVNYGCREPSHSNDCQCSYRSAKYVASLPAWLPIRL